MLSCLRNADFGPVISIGTGGVAIELYRDVAYLALPVSEEQVLAALRKLKLWTLLQGFRGKPAADVDREFAEAWKGADTRVVLATCARSQRLQGSCFTRAGTQ